MALWNRFNSWWRHNKTPEPTTIEINPPTPPNPEQIQELPAADDATFTKESRKYLQRLDELITISEAEIETLNIELDKLIKHESFVKEKLQNNKESWSERTLLLQLERIEIHRKNIQQRLEIYNQNIRVYLNLISRIQDVQAMRMGGIDENKIASVWLEFRESLEQYKERLMTEEASKEDCAPITTTALEQNLEKLKESIFPTPKVEPRIEILPKIEESPKEKIFE